MEEHDIPTQDSTPLEVHSFPEDEQKESSEQGHSVPAEKQVRDFGHALRKIAGIGTLGALVTIGAMHSSTAGLKQSGRLVSLPDRKTHRVSEAVQAPIMKASSARPEDASVDLSHMTPAEQALAQELRRMGTRLPREFVTVIAEALGPDSRPNLPLHLALANAETSGDVLDVSEAGAAGLAQATPIAILQQGYAGPLYITDDYATGARAYFLKKPLDDADTIATVLVEHGRTEANWDHAASLLGAAERYRCLGIEELQVLTPYVGADFQPAIEAMDAHNLERLNELGHLLERHASHGELRQYRDQVRIEYRALRTQQRASWAAYQASLINVRDEALRAMCGVEPRLARKQFPYEAGELLSTIDIRFSPRDAAAFLRDHIAAKRVEAQHISGGEGNQKELIERLYNGGSHNVLRMRAGLIRKLKENDDYVARISRFENRLSQSLPREHVPNLRTASMAHSPEHSGVR